MRPDETFYRHHYVRYKWYYVSYHNMLWSLQCGPGLCSCLLELNLSGKKQLVMQGASVGPGDTLYTLRCTA
jgi:hypothetical protein